VPGGEKADKKGVLEIAKESAELAGKAREESSRRSTCRAALQHLRLGGIGGRTSRRSSMRLKSPFSRLAAHRCGPQWNGTAFMPRLILPALAAGTIESWMAARTIQRAPRPRCWPMREGSPVSEVRVPNIGDFRTCRSPVLVSRRQVETSSRSSTLESDKATLMCLLPRGNGARSDSDRGPVSEAPASDARCAGAGSKRQSRPVTRRDSTSSSSDPGRRIFSRLRAADLGKRLH